MVTPLGRTLLERWIYVLVKSDDAFVCPYTVSRRRRIVDDPAYGEPFAAWLDRFESALAENRSWPAGSYFPGGWYRNLLAQGLDPAAASIEPDQMAPFYLDELLVDASGRWRVAEQPVSGRVLGYFLRNLHFDAELGRYVVRYRNEQHVETRYVHHLTPPIRVRRVTVGAQGIKLWLNTGQDELLRPETLRMDDGEQLYCAVGEQLLPAWFEEPARWELLKDADEHAGDWRLWVNGRELPARLNDPWTYADRIPAREAQSR